MFGSNLAANVNRVKTAGASQLSGKVKAAFQKLTESATEQSSAVQETMASIEQMRSMLTQTDHHVSHSLSLAQKASDDSDKRLKTVQKMQSALMAVKQSNELLNDLQAIFAAIKNKTRVINDIVFKTQLLSFNASIEAARAGHFGKGFSVVAEEVGRLAQTSGKASKEIETLIYESQKKATSVVSEVIARAEEGANVSTEALASFEEMGNVISEISKSLTAMSEASREQLQGIEQTTMAIEKINRLADENRKSAEGVLHLADEAGKQLPLMPSAPQTKQSRSELLKIVENISQPAIKPVVHADIKNINADHDTFKPQS